MRLVIQRVKSSEVQVAGEIVGKIGMGFLVLVGVGDKDSPKDADLLVEKLVKLRIMADGEKKMNLSVIDTGSSLLVVSQFTLYADIKGGNRPSFIKAAGAQKAKELYDHFIDLLRGKGINVATGLFGEYMEIHSLLDGPVTIILESEDLK